VGFITSHEKAAGVWLGQIIPWNFPILMAAWGSLRFLSWRLGKLQPYFKAGREAGDACEPILVGLIGDFIGGFSILPAGVA